jgi:hypothetical protein
MDCVPPVDRVKLDFSGEWLHCPVSTLELSFAEKLGIKVENGCTDFVFKELGRQL